MADPQIKLPPGATLVQDDSSGMKLPPGAVLDADSSGSTPGELKASVYDRLTSPIDPGLDQFSKEHPVLGAGARFMSSAGAAVLGLPGSVYHAVADPATPEEEKEAGEKITGVKRIGLGIGRLTGARDIVEAGKAYADPKTRPTLKQAASVLPEALGTGTGVVAGSEVGGRVLSKVGQLRAAMRDKFQPTARKVTGVEPAVKEAVTKAAEKHTEALADTEAQKVAAQERGTLAKSVDEQSHNLKGQLEKVEASVAKEANAKFEKVREKIGNPTADSAALVDTVKNVEANVLQNIPENIKEFRAILKSEPLPASIQGPAEAYAASKGFELEGPEPMTWEKLQSLKSRLDARLRSRSAMNGDLKRALYQTRDAVVGEMGKMAEANGAQAEWADARDTWRQYKEDFHESTGPSGSGSPIAQALNALDPKSVRQPFLRTQSAIGNRALEILRKYPQHGGTEAATTAERMLGEQGKLKYMPDKNPNPAAPPAPVVDQAAIARREIAARSKNWGSFNARDIGILASSILFEPIREIFGTSKNQLGAVNLIPGAALAYEGGKFAMSRALTRPKVIEWLSRTPPAEVEVINKIPGADKVKIINLLTDEAVQGKVKNLSPAARTLLGPANVAKILAASGATQHQVKNAGEARERLRSLTQTAQ